MTGGAPSSARSPSSSGASHLERPPARNLPSVDLLSQPFRLRPDGMVATVVDGTDEAAGEAIATLVRTRRGERELVPEFGITDPAFGSVSADELNAALAAFGPALRVTSVDADPVDDRNTRVVITYEEA